MKKITSGTAYTWICIAGAIAGSVFVLFDVFAQKCEVERVEKQSIETFKEIQESIDLQQQSIKCNRTFDRIVQMKDEKRRLKMLIKERPNDSELPDDLEALNERIKVSIHEYEKLQ